MSAPDHPAAETSHPAYVAEVLADGIRAAVSDREAIVGHIAICPEYAAWAAANNVRGNYQRRFAIFFSTMPTDRAFPAVCPHQHDSRIWRLDKSAFAGTYEEAVALMHQWVAEYREKGAPRQ